MSSYMGENSIRKLLNLIREKFATKEDVNTAISEITIEEIANDQIDAICGSTIVNADEMEF